MKPTSRDLMVARVVRDVQFTRAYRLDDQDITEIIESLPEPAELVKYGCHCDIENTVSGEPDECVFDNGDIEDCVYATQLQREDKGKLQCKYWKPVSRPEPAEHEQPAHTPNSEAPHHPACTRSFDARDWARDFRETAKSLGYCDMDEGWLIGWFANAIMRGFDEAEQHREQPAPDVRPKWCNVHQHHKWCEHNGGVMGPTGYAAPDVQAQIDAAVAREREECARVAEWVWDSGNHGAHGGEQANRTATAIRARSAKGV